MRLSLDIGSGPNIHKTIITSAVLHLMFIAIVAVPFRTKERVENNYFVNLVSPAEIRKIHDTVLPDKPDRKPEKIAKAESENTHQIKKTELHRAIPEENENIWRDRQDSMPIKKGYIGPAYEEKEDFRKQQYMIARENKPLQTEPVRIDKGQREPIPAPKEGLQKQQYVIARAGKPVRTSPEPLDRGYRGQVFEEKENIQEQQFTIAVKDKQVRTESVPKSLKSDANGNSGVDLKRNDEIDYSEQMKGAGAIEKPGLPDKSGEGEIAYKSRGEQASEDAGLKREKEIFGNDKLSASEFSIKGVPLNDLIACPNALDERALKKKILNIIGDNKICNSPAKGKFVFLGTGRFTSFDMIIMPVSGRELSNRCEELENAYICLIQ